MQTEFGADARGDDRRIELPPAPLLHLGRDLQRCPAGRVFFLGVMALFDARLVLREGRDELPRAPRQSEGDIRAGREVRGVDTANARLGHAGAHVVEALVPAGGADHQADAVVAGHAQRVVERRGVREVDEHLGAGERLVAIDVEDADDVVAPLLGHRLDGPAHLPVAVNGELHTPTGASNSAA